MNFSLRPLPFAEDALAPHISAETLRCHHGRHLATYVEKTNALAAGTDFEKKSLEEIVKTAPAGPLFNNAAQVWNHEFYFENLSPTGGGEPGGALGDAIAAQFGSFARFREEFEKSAAGHFGSGWTWLVRTAGGPLDVRSTANAETPLRPGDATPLLVCDVWEHAYYLDRQNRRPEYLSAFFEVVDWEKVAERFAATA